MALQELYKKHHILTDGLKRIYFQETSDRHLDMTSSTPISLIIYADPEWGNNTPFRVCLTTNPQVFTFQETAWTALLTKLITFLQKNNPQEKEVLYSHKLDWTERYLFTDKKVVVNSVKLDDDLYFSLNYAANHSSWVIDDLLKLYGINRGTLLIHRTPFSEPKEVVDEIKKVRIEQFRKFLIEQQGLNEEKAEKIINVINGPLNKLLAKEGGSYSEFFVFDDTLLLSSLKSKLLARLPYITSWNEKQLNTARKYLDYLTVFYTFLAKEAKKHKEDLEYTILIM